MNLYIDPMFLRYDENGIPTDFHLAGGSPLVGAGQDKGDLGAYGGSLRDQWDLDLDGFPDYFWPGNFMDMDYEGSDRAQYDCNDSLPTVHLCE